MSSDPATDSTGSDAASEIDASPGDGGFILDGGDDSGGADTSTNDGGGPGMSAGDAGSGIPCGEGRPGPGNTGPDDTPLTRMDGRLEIATPGVEVSTACR